MSCILSSSNILIVDDVMDRPKPLPSRAQTRTSYYLVGLPISALKISKLTKNCVVLLRVLTLLQKEKCIKSVCLDVGKEVCEVWKHQFGLRLVCGKDSVEQKRIDKSVKFIMEVQHIAEMHVARSGSRKRKVTL